MYVLYRVLLNLIHVLYSCLETFMVLWCCVRKKYENFWCKSELKDDFYYVTNFVRNVKNIPSHLAFILINEDEIVCFEDLANIVLWSLAAGVSFVSFYDHNGLLKRFENKLRVEVSRRGSYGDSIVWGTPPSNGKVHSNGIGGGPSHNGTSNGTKNGFKAHQPLRVVLLSREDGRESLARAAMLLAEESRAEGVEASIAQTTRALHTLYQVTIMSCSNREKVLRVLPCFLTLSWLCGAALSAAMQDSCLGTYASQSFCEQLHSLHVITVQQFTSLLCQYSKCEQRYGK
ncbi:hypothetical protein B566_EDAN012610 [Ephemera danica]|nr:hypothetical protein B566_EDAN012610 [Ephemera danica]